MYPERRSVARCATPDVSDGFYLISPSLIPRQCTAENETRLLSIVSFRDAEPANLVLQSRALQSQPFGRSAIACYTSCRSA